MISWAIVIVCALFIAWVYAITVKALRKPLPPKRRHRPFEDAFDRQPRRFGKRTTPPIYFERIDT